jgi:hypothetical protein
MTLYRILPRVHQAGFVVEVSGANGARNTILGFETEEEASAWVNESRKLDLLRRPDGAD